MTLYSKKKIRALHSAFAKKKISECALTFENFGPDELCVNGMSFSRRQVSLVLWLIFSSVFCSSVFCVLLKSCVSTAGPFRGARLV